MTTPEFTVDVEPRKIHTQEANGAIGTRTVYDLKVKDINGNLLVFSHQGYEDRAFATQLAIRLFGGKPARLNVWDSQGQLDVSYELWLMAI